VAEEATGILAQPRVAIPMLFSGSAVDEGDDGGKITDVKLFTDMTGLTPRRDLLLDGFDHQITY
jgi:hypothetical protein